MSLGDMKTHVVQSGDCLLRIAALYRTTVSALRDLKENAALFEKGRTANMLVPGDLVFVPDTPALRLRLDVEKTNPFHSKVPRVPVRVKLVDRDGKPAANKPYDWVCGVETRTGHTDADGMLEETVSALALRAEVWIELESDQPRRKIVLQLGSLEPPIGVKGIRQRLENMGHLRTSSESLGEALRVMQGREGKEQSFEEIRDAVVKAHGG